MLLEKIEFQLFDTPSERIVEQIDCFLEIHDTFLRYAISCYATVPDDDDDLKGKWSDIFSHKITIAMKRLFAGVIVRFHDGGFPRYSATLEFSGSNGDINLIFKNASQAEELANKIMKWSGHDIGPAPSQNQPKKKTSIRSLGNVHKKRKPR